MPEITSLFVTRLYRAGLNDLAKKKVDYAELHQTCDMAAEDDEAGQEWCEASGDPATPPMPAGRPALADVDLRRSGKGAGQARRRLCKDLGFDLGEKEAEGEFALDQHPARRRHPRQPHPPAFGDLGHDLRRDARRGPGALKLEVPRLPMMMLAPAP